MAVGQRIICILIWLTLNQEIKIPFTRINRNDVNMQMEEGGSTIKNAPPRARRIQSIPPGSCCCSQSIKQVDCFTKWATVIIVIAVCAGTFSPPLPWPAAAAATTAAAPKVVEVKGGRAGGESRKLRSKRDHPSGITGREQSTMGNRHRVGQEKT